MIEPLELTALVQKYAAATTGKSAALKSAIRKGVTERVLQPDDELPSTRRAAEALSMSRNSVIEAYEGLQAEGVIKTRRGARPRICALPDLKPMVPENGLPIALSARGRVLSADQRSEYVNGRVDAFAPGLPDPSLFPRDDWAVCLRRVARRDLRELEFYDEYQGLPDLRRAVALHLKRYRGVSVSTDQIFILPNTQSGAALLSDLVTDAGDTVLCEDPGYIGAKALFEAKGLKVRALPERFGSGTRTHSAKLIYITPSTQYPTGSRMQLRRRLDILGYAETQNALIIEDDYDGDFVWRDADVPPVFSLNRATSVALLGTLSKSIMPGMRVGWLIVPPVLVEDVRRAHRTLGLSVNVSIQAALAEFMSSGLFARHLRSAAKTYQTRMRMLTDALKRCLGNSVPVSLPDGGLQVVLHLEEHMDDKDIADALWRHGFEVLPMSRLCIDRQDKGLVIGFARANEKRSEALSAAVRNLIHKR